MRRNGLLHALLLAAAAGLVALLWPRSHRRGVIGNRRSHVYHDPGCRFAPEGASALRFAGAVAAEAAGYRPCRACTARDRRPGSGGGPLPDPP